MNVTSDNFCFVCGKENPNGLKAVFDVDPVSHRASCRMAIPRDFQGWEGVVHGGIIATLLDETCIYACRTLHDRLVTADLSVRYKKPLPVGAVFTVHAEMASHNRRTVSARAWLEVDGTRHAEAEAKMFIIKN